MEGHEPAFIAAVRASVFRDLPHQPVARSRMEWKAPNPSLPWVPKAGFGINDGPHGLSEFMGPPTSHVFGLRYSTLSHRGLKDEGQEVGGPPIWSEAEAWSEFKRVLRMNVAGARQIAWRRMPAAEQNEEGSWSVTARLAIFKGEAA